jgi:hypothetical protein
MTALAQERSLSSALDRQKGEALSLNRKDLAYGALEREAISNRQVYEALQQQAKDLMAQLADEKAKKTEREAELAKRAEELENTVGRYSLRETEGFKQKYVQPAEAEYRKAVAALSRAGVAPDEAQGIVAKMIKSQNPEEIESALADLPRFTQGVVAAAVYEAQEYARQGNEAEANWKQTKAALGHESSQIEETKFKQALIKETADAAQQLAEKFGSWAFAPDPSNPKSMDWREKAVLTAQHILERGSDTDIARAVLESVASPQYRKWGEAWKAKALALQSELEAREGSRPRLGAGGQAPAPELKAPEIPKSMSIQEGIRKAAEMAGIKLPQR